MKFIKGGKYPEAEIGKYVYAAREGQYRQVRQYVTIKISVAHDVTWDNWYTTPRGRWKNKGKKHLKICNLECVEPLWFGCLGRIAWQIALTNGMCEVHTRRIRISLVVNSKRC